MLTIMNLPSLPPLLLFFLLLLCRPAISLCDPHSAPHDRLLTNSLPPRPASSSSSTPTPAPAPAPAPMRPPRRAAAISPLASASPPPSFGAVVDTALAGSVTDAIHSLQSAFLDGTVVDVCGMTDHPDLCESSVRSMATPGQRLDARAVLRMEMKAAATMTRAALDRAEALEAEAEALEAEAEAGGDRRARSMLGVCADGYEDALSDLEVAERAAEGNDKGTLGSYLSALFSDYDGCSDAFAEAKRASPMKADEDLLTKLASNCLAIAELL